MLTRTFIDDRFRHLFSAGKWAALVVPMAAVVGSLCAGFLWALDLVTETRFAHPALLFGLPFAGIFIGLVYYWIGRPAEGGNNLIVDQIHEPGGGIPLRMAPLILVATVATHLFGGSVGREGTAVQLGGSIASAFATMARLESRAVRVLLIAGIAAGFGAVFGTPVAGAVFALEVLSIGRVEYDALVPALFAAIVADWTCHAWGVHHVAYHIAFAGYAEAGGPPFHVDALLLAKVALASVAFGLAGLFFSEASHSVGAIFKKLCPIPYLRPGIGGLLVIALVYALGTREYLGLGVWSPNPGDASIVSFFGPIHYAWAWAWKIVFTVVSLGAGFKGGEVTPLFFIGAGLGNAIAGIIDAPLDLFAALGFVAIFAAASNTPLACTIMGIELFGATHTVYIAVACFLAYLCSGHSGIYLSQRIAIPKTTDTASISNVSLRHARETRPSALHPALRRRGREGKNLPKPSQMRELALDTTAHTITHTDVGMVRIYMRPQDRYRTSGKRRVRDAFSSRPLYQELIQRAKRSGLVNAIAHHTHYGFANHGHVEQREVESANVALTMCVELIAPRAQLVSFCSEQGDLLKDKVVVYKNLERWVMTEDAALLEAS